MADVCRLLAGAVAKGAVDERLPGVALVLSARETTNHAPDQITHHRACEPANAHRTCREATCRDRLTFVVDVVVLVAAGITTAF